MRRGRRARAEKQATGLAASVQTHSTASARPSRASRLSRSLTLRDTGSVITRRGFLGRLAALVAATALPLPDAAPAVPALCVSTRFIGVDWGSAEDFTVVCRFDLLYGWAAIKEPLACRVVAD